MKRAWMAAAAVAGCAGGKGEAKAPHDQVVVVEVADHAQAQAGAQSSGDQPTGDEAAPIDGEGVDPQEARALAMEQAKQAGILGVLKACDEGDEDCTAAWGNLWGDSLGEDFAAGGLGLKGVGKGGGGSGEGTIGIGSLGATGKGSGSGYGAGSGLGRQAKGPSVAIGATKQTGKLDKEVIRRIVRSRIKEVRTCYETALTKDPDLEGRLAVRFVIASDGAVSQVSIEAQDLDQNDMVKCVRGVFETMAFPAPDGGVVNVSYPLVFKSGP